MTGVKEVTLTPAEPKPEKAKRRSALAGVKELAARVAAKLAEVDESRKVLDQTTAKHYELVAESRALIDAYDLVKPQPRRKAAKS